MPDQLVTLWRYRDLPKALVARAKLDSQQIWCVLADDNIVRLNWYLSNAVGGLRLQVAEEDAELALELLAEEIPESFTAEEVGEEYRQPMCPKCGSRDVSYESFARGVALVFLQFGLPIWIPSRSWHCEDCWHKWKDTYE